MARYRVKVRSYIGGSLHEPGAIVSYDGKPGSNLELYEKAAPVEVAEEPARRGPGRPKKG